MLNLIRKDIVLQKKILLILLPILFIYLFSGSSTVLIGVLFSIVINMTAFATDEKSSINVLLNALPYTRKEIVSSKYIGAFVFTFLVLLTIFIANWVINGEIIELEQLLFIICIVSLFISIAFPFSYFFKSQYLLIAWVISFVIYMIVGNFIFDINTFLQDIIQTFLSFTTTQLYLLMIVFVVIFYILSWMLSIRIYSKKVF